MTTKTIDQMIAELPHKWDTPIPKCTEIPLPEAHYYLYLLECKVDRFSAEVALLRAALEGVLRITNHVYECPAAYARGGVCTCGYDDANKVLEVTK